MLGSRCLPGHQCTSVRKDAPPTSKNPGERRLHPRGRCAYLRGWCAVRDTSPLQTQSTRDHFLARLFFAPRMPIDEIRKLLDARRREVSEQLRALEPISIADAAPEIVTEVEHAHPIGHAGQWHASRQDRDRLAKRHRTTAGRGHGMSHLVSASSAPFPYESGVVFLEYGPGDQRQSQRPYRSAEHPLGDGPPTLIRVGQMGGR